MRKTFNLVTVPEKTRPWSLAEIRHSYMYVTDLWLKKCIQSTADLIRMNTATFGNLAEFHGTGVIDLTRI